MFKEIFASGWFWTLLIGVLTTTGVSIFAKTLPKKRIVDFLKPKFYKAGVFLSDKLALKIGRKDAQKIEEGVIVTICFAIAESLNGFIDGLLYDNK